MNSARKRSWITITKFVEIKTIITMMYELLSSYQPNGMTKEVTCFLSMLFYVYLIIFQTNPYLQFSLGLFFPLSPKCLMCQKWHKIRLMTEIKTIWKVIKDEWGFLKK